MPDSIKKNIAYTSIIAVSHDAVRQRCEKLLKNEGHHTHSVDSLDALYSVSASAKADLVVLDASFMDTSVTVIAPNIRENNKRARIILMYEESSDSFRDFMHENLIHACFDIHDADAKLLLTVDSVLRYLPMLDLLSDQFRKIKTQIKVSEKNKEGLRYIISAMPETINRLQPLDKFIRGVLIQMCGFLNAENSFLATRDDNEKLIILVGTGCFDVNEKTFLHSGFHEEYADELYAAIEERRTILRPHYMLIPLKAKDRVIGLFYLEKPEAEIEALEEDMMKLFASQASITIENSNLFTLATEDGLTGLFVRRHFFTRFQDVLQYASRLEGQPVSFMITDIDHFKAINDTYGHPVGDEVLIAVSKLLKDSFRVTDIVGRIGGEEFAIVLPDTKLTYAEQVANTVREAVKKLSFTHNGQTFSVSISVGVAGFDSYRADAENMRDKDASTLITCDQKRLMLEADKALYYSKENGRDRVTVAKIVPLKEE